MSDKTTSSTLNWNKRESCAAEIEQGEFCYAYDDYGRVKWVHFWPYDSPCALSAAISPQRNGSGATWALSGTGDGPTLTPSVDAVGIWHGYLTNGSARSV